MISIYVYSPYKIDTLWILLHKRNTVQISWNHTITQIICSRNSQYKCSWHQLYPIKACNPQTQILKKEPLNIYPLFYPRGRIHYAKSWYIYLYILICVCMSSIIQFIRMYDNSGQPFCHVRSLWSLDVLDSDLWWYRNFGKQSTV